MPYPAATGNEVVIVFLFVVKKGMNIFLRLFN